MSTIEQTIFCSGCGAEITWAPIIKGNRRFCCQDCLTGKGCKCGSRQDLDDDGRGQRAISTTSIPTGTL